MQINQKMVEAINKQINEELFSSYLYLAMAADFESKNFSGMSHWMKKQSKEEMEHAMRFFKFVNERGGKVILEQIEKPQTGWQTVTEAFEDAYKHEQMISSKIDALVDLAKQENDKATASMLKWFVDEQVEEEASALEIVEKLKMASESKGALMMIDHKLGMRK